MILIWVQLLCRHAREIQTLFTRLPAFILVTFPSRAPELKPVEQVWLCLQKETLAKLAAQNAGESAADADSSMAQGLRGHSLPGPFQKVTPTVLTPRTGQSICGFP